MAFKLFTLAPFVAAVLSLCLGLIVFFKNRKSNIGISFLIVCIAVFFWLFSYCFVWSLKDLEIVLFFGKLAYTAIVCIPSAIFYFTISLLNLRDRIKFLRFCYLSFSISFMFIILIHFTNLIINGLNIYCWGYYMKAGLFNPVVILFYSCMYSISLYLIFLHIRKGDISKLERSRINVVFYSLFIPFFCIFDFLPNYGIPYRPLGYLFIFCWLLITAYAIVRYRLMDIRIAITRTGIFIVVYSLVLGVPFALAFGWQERLIKIFGANWWILPLISSTLLATIGPFIYLYINKKAEEKLLKEQRSYQNILRNASSGMIRIKDLSRLLNVVVHVITKTVKIKYAAVYLLDKETNNFILQAARGRSGFGKQGDYIVTGSPLIWQLSLRKKPIVTEEELMKLRDEAQDKGIVKFVEQLLKLNASLVVPSFIDDKLTGILILGEKVSGKLYSEDDLVVFSVLANQAALAIENAQFYDEVKRTHEQLFHAEKLATIGTMADGLSHQINNRFHALSLIAGDSLDFLKHCDMSSFSAEAKGVLSELKSALERIENNVLQGGEVVKGLLKYSRPGESGFELVSFQDVLNGSIDMVQYKIKLKEIDLIQSIPNNLPSLHGNLTQLQEVFFNFIDNAYDATQERRVILKEDGFKGRIEVSASALNGSVEISVKDNGMGVKDLDKKKLFTPFFTTKATAKKGTGLGLYVIDKIIAAHNGKIAIDSIYKSGTRFTITLPTSPKS